MFSFYVSYKWQSFQILGSGYGTFNYHYLGPRSTTAEEDIFYILVLLQALCGIVLIGNILL